METVTQVAEVYRKEFEDTYEGLRQRGSTLQESSSLFLNETQAQIEPVKQEYIGAITDISDLPAVPTRPVLASFGWASVLVLAASLGSLLGAYVLGPLIGLFVGGFGTALGAFVVLPVYSYYYIKQAETDNTPDASVRFTLLSIALGMGILSGFCLAQSYLSAQPLAFLTPLVIAVAFPKLAESLGSSRVNLLAACLSASLGLNLALGLVCGFLTFPYFVLSLLYTASAAVTLQLLFKNVQNPEQRVHLYQLALLTSFLVSKAVIFGCFGSAEPVVEETATTEK